MVCWEASIQVPRVPILADHDAGMLNCIVWEEQLAGDDSSGRGTGGIAYERLQPAGLRDCVVVQKDQVLSRGSCSPIVACKREAGVGRVCYNTDPASVACEKLRSHISRGIVDDDNLAVNAFSAAGQ